jgi:hypothetical protein
MEGSRSRSHGRTRKNTEGSRSRSIATDEHGKTRKRQKQRHGKEEEKIFET